MFQRAAGRMQYALDHITGKHSTYVAPNELANLYGERPPDKIPDDIWYVSNEAVAEELHLNGGQSDNELRRIRRAFAFYNHPDRVPAKWRDHATQRMSIANAMIDNALKKNRHPRR